LVQLAAAAAANKQKDNNTHLLVQRNVQIDAHQDILSLQIDQIGQSLNIQFGFLQGRRVEASLGGETSSRAKGKGGQHCRFNDKIQQERSIN
jgi:hypothetical protein